MQRRAWALGTCIVSFVLSSPSLADYPDKPITVIVAASAGGTTDIGVRTWAPYLEACLGNGTSITVLNRPGAQNRIGFTEIANSAPDGYTLGALTMPGLVTTQIEGEVTYRTSDYVPLGSFFVSGQTINVATNSPIKTFQEIVDKAKSTNGPITFGLSTFGSDDHFLAMRLAKKAGLEINVIPFGDSALARNAIIGGHTEIGLISITDAAPFQDQLRSLAVSTSERFSGLPDVPTLNELGYDLGEVVSRHTIGAPAGLPGDIKAKLSGCFDQIGTDERFLAEALERNLVVEPMSASEVGEFYESEYKTLKELWDAAPWK